LLTLTHAVRARGDRVGPFASTASANSVAAEAVGPVLEQSIARKERHLLAKEDA